MPPPKPLPLPLPPPKAPPRQRSSSRQTIIYRPDALTRLNAPFL